MKNKKYTLYVGLNDKDTKQQEMSNSQINDIITNTCLNHKIEAFTLIEAKGVYTHDNGAIVYENTLKIEFLFTNKNVIVNIAKELKKALNQESILLNVETCASDFI